MLKKFRGMQSNWVRKKCKVPNITMTEEKEKPEEKPEEKEPEEKKEGE